MFLSDSEEKEARSALRTVLNDDAAEFKPGQLEAILSLVAGAWLLVVQATGWGKSAVYWVTAKLLRDQGKGLTIVVSPLLSLMRNQVQHALQGGLRAETLNSSNTGETFTIQSKIEADEVDVLFVSPERLAKPVFVKNVINPLIEKNKIGLFVIDETHCISEWGHDFRPDYRRIAGFIKRLPNGIPVLATTATANSRVISDIKGQVDNLTMVRGSLLRKSLSFQCINIPDKVSRLAWLADKIPQLPGAGIVYCLTVSDSEHVAKWLRQNGIAAEAYHASVKSEDYPYSDDYRVFLENQLINNNVKVLVATTALGMGFDKPDLGFVIHYNMPLSLIAYYQQAGRAGRKLAFAYAILLYGSEDNEVNEYFIENAFPDKKNVEAVLKALGRFQDLSISHLEKHVNLRQGKIKDMLKLLEVMDQPPVTCLNGNWRRTKHPLVYSEKTDFLINRRMKEWREVKNYFHNGQECRMSFIRKVLDDNDVAPCGKCDICNPQSKLSDTFSQAVYANAVDYVFGLREGEILPRQMVPAGSLSKLDLTSLKPYQHRHGRYMYRLQRSEIEALIATEAGRDKLIKGLASYYQAHFKQIPQPSWMTYVPSTRWGKPIQIIAEGVADKLNLELRRVFSKKVSQHNISDFNNSNLKCRFIADNYKLIKAPQEIGAVLLFDLMYDSGWTIAVLTALLRKRGSGQVFPFALASSRKG